MKHNFQTRNLKFKNFAAVLHVRFNQFTTMHPKYGQYVKDNCMIFVMNQVCEHVKFKLCYL